MHNRVGRTILAIVVALSIAILPVAAAFATAGKTVEPSISVTTPDCDHHHDRPSGKIPKNAGGCDSMADCAFKCFTTTAVSFSSVVFFPAPYTALEHVAISDDISPHTGSLPFRPPRS